MNYAIEYLFSAIVVLISLSAHELAHGYTAYKLGDPTAKYMGRLTLNPIKHIDPYGLICMVLFRIGWAKPVPINPRYFKKPKRDTAICAIAGPLTNLVLAFIATFSYVLLVKIFTGVTLANDFLFNVVDNTCLFIYLFAIINVSLAVFNLLPIPPFDGSRIAFSLLPDKLYFKVMRYERTIYFVILGWLFLGDIFADGLMSLPFARGNVIFEAVAKILSLSDLISAAIGFVFEAMVRLITLIPFFN